jgi:hypothetical protein
MKKILVLLAALSLFGCNKTTENSTVLDVGFEFSVFNAQNEDLLDPATNNFYDEKEIKLFYKVGGEVNEVYLAGTDNPRNFKIFKHEKEYRIGIVMNHIETSEKTVTYIQWNDSDTDTIETTFESSRNDPKKRKVWLNGVEIWDWTTNENEYYKMIK